MRDRMERLVLLPFSIGCVSESSVAVGVHHPRRTSNKPHQNNNNDHHHANPSTIRTKEEDEESLSSTDESMKNGMANSKPNISDRFQRIVKGLKTFSQLFVYEEEIEEMEMEIGLPTDVKHVTHIGWDDCAASNNNNNNNNNNNQIQGWDNLISPENLLSLQPSSLTQFQLSMAPTKPDTSPLIVKPSSA